MKKIIADSSAQTLPTDVAEISRSLRDSKMITFFKSSKEPDSDANQSFSTLSATTDEIESKKTNYPLERWDIQAYAYSEKQAAKVSLLAGLFGGEVEKVKAGVIHEAKRFSIESTDKHNVEIGVAVRLSVATSNLDTNIDLTLPNLAASAQLKDTDTRVGISVTGFTGPLGQYLPAPTKLNVESCIEYMNAFREIQKIVFGEESMAFIIPTVLNYEEKV
ncbi:hypothetical protein [Leucothrix arctica]|uniref:Uncharacterized protein n=1 Tax=Leucothrix arctica TaxID=1481894 RepID=A0A317CEK2_9GAMM|nr:hypothetical protein [Leucothrix arctica]PWQ94730.1 hypothetical protein DKT75_15705 [Leucothrix arctica]